MPAPPTADETLGNEVFHASPKTEKSAPFSAEDPKIIRTFLRAKKIDTFARWSITVGGILVIFCVVGMMFFIAGVGLPLFIPPSSQLLSQFQIKTTPQDKILAVGVDEYLETGFSLNQTGTWSFYMMKDGKTINQVVTNNITKNDTRLRSIETYDNKLYSLLWEDGSTTVVEIKFLPKFNEGVRTITHQVNRIADFPGVSDQTVLQTFARVSGEDDSRKTTLVQLLNNNRIQAIQQVVEEDLMGDQQEETYSTIFQSPIEEPISAITVDQLGNTVYAGTKNGHLLQWNISEPGEAELIGQIQAFEDSRAITALSVVFGENSIAVGDEKGELTVWFQGKVSEGQPALQLAHIYAPHNSPVIRILPSTRNKSFTSLDEAGNIRISHMTSERRLLDLSSAQPYQTFGFSTRNNGMVALDAQNRVSMIELKIPHPEVSWQVLFGKVWYEGYPEADYVWQSSAATDDFEPKFSLTTLVFGSLKGTFYAMVFSIPLALFGAIYTSEFCKDTYRRYLKPGIEIMAAMPSVIIGFLIALWLAPIVEQYVISFFLSTMVIPLVTIGFLFVWQMIRENAWCKKVEGGYEFLIIIPVILLGAWLATVLQAPVENIFFGGDFQNWLYQEAGMRYDQRNSIIIGYGLGFLVIPLIFTICDDALTNVPKSLKAASLSLGASRWQTLWRVVLPSASPGIFAGIIIGFGRAIGETMVVLMATGNTPIMDWSVFNGMRTLAANIAVELPEAPVDGTLYRILFLSAALLFLITFVLNTFAEVIRQRLRKSYGQF